MYPINHPEFMLPNAADYFDEDGNLTDKETCRRIQELIEALAEWTLKLKEKPRQP